MANLAAVLKAEIARLARKETRAQLDPLRKAGAGYRRDIAALKREVSTLSRRLKLASRPAKADVTAAEDGARLRFSAKGLKSHRERLGLSAAEFGALAGVSAQSIYNWEAGKATPRAAQVQSLAALRGIGKREVRARLADAGGQAGGTTKQATGKATKKATKRPSKKAAGKAAGKSQKPRAPRRARVARAPATAGANSGA